LLYPLLGDRLTLSRLKQPVLYQTSFSFTGWAYRTLESSELAVAFELPEFVEWTDGLAVEALPLQLLRSVMEHFLPRVQVAAEPDPPGKRRKLESSPQNVRSLSESNVVDMQWLPLLSRWLPESWTEKRLPLELSSLTTHASTSSRGIGAFRLFSHG
jgi:hypothetical protein